MTKKSVFGACATSALMAGFVGGFMGCPVMAEGPVDIRIVEKVDDGSGGYREWQDITGAMPGMSYSAIPAVENQGALPAYVWMCLSQSVTSGGQALPRDNIFDINIKSEWVPETKEFADKYLGAGKCYRYDSMLEVEDTTKPIFTEVTLSPALANEYQNATFSLHLDAYALDEIPEEPGGADDPGDSAATDVNTPSNPDTGNITKSEALSTPWMIGLCLGLGVLTIIVGLYIAKVAKQHK